MRLNVSVSSVAPYAGAWIETSFITPKSERQSVAPYAGAWIETRMEWRGNHHKLVAPYAGAWIETTLVNLPDHSKSVAPYAGAWIETFSGRVKYGCVGASPPTRGRGLKLFLHVGPRGAGVSPPTRGRGLKPLRLRTRSRRTGRPLRGGVD